MASLLIFNRMDKVSISKRLGHSSIAVTEEIYGHLIEEADQQSADIIADVFLKKAWFSRASWIKVEFWLQDKNLKFQKSYEKARNLYDSGLNLGTP